MTRCLAAALVALALAGCGGSDASEPRLPAALADDLATFAEDAAAFSDSGDPCAAREQAVALQHATVEAINARRVPKPLQEPLLSAVNDLAFRLRCP
jgi:hypothetical protein